MRILGIETSCDDTGIAILEAKGVKNPHFSVLSNVVSSQTQVHQQYGGVFPMMAAREHQKNLVPVLMNALQDAGLLQEKKRNRDIKNHVLEDIFKNEPELSIHTKKFLQDYAKPEIDTIA